MEWIVKHLFPPPDVPPLALPVPARLIPGVKQAIWKTMELLYYRGVWDGFTAGVLLTTTLFTAVLLHRGAGRRP